MTDHPKYLEAIMLLALFSDFDGRLWIENGRYCLAVYARKTFGISSKNRPYVPWKYVFRYTKPESLYQSVSKWIAIQQRAAA